MLDQATLQQLSQIFAELNHSYTLEVEVTPNHPSREMLMELLNEVASVSPRITLQERLGQSLRWSLLKEGQPTGISMRAVPTGHEFTTLLLAILNADGKGKNLPDPTLRANIAAIKGPVRVRTYVSLTCTNCPDVVQSLNMMTLLHPDMEHETIDGAINQEEANALHLQGVPAVFVGDKLIHSGRGDTSTLIQALTAHYGQNEAAQKPSTPKHYDIIVVGAGPAGSAAAIYSARKGLKVAVLATRVGGQVKDTVGIENLISVPSTTGAQLAQNLAEHMAHYPIDLFEQREVIKASLRGKEKELHTQLGELFTAPAVIIATGASWRKLNVPGEAEHIGRGVAFCPHCDGPFYKGKEVAVVGGGNSGIEAAIDLAGICSKVTVLEFLPELKADEVLQHKVTSLSNVEVRTNQQTLSVQGTGQNVTGIRIKDRSSGNESTITLDGIFVQIGLLPNSDVFAEQLHTEQGQIVVDAHCRTSLPGVYAAGDVSTVPYKQIVVAMGEGAKAALAAFDDRIRTKA